MPVGNGNWIKVTRAQRGWICEVLFTASAANQFTDEQFEYRTGSRFAWLAFLKGMVGHKFAKRRIEAAAMPQRVLNGWK